MNYEIIKDRKILEEFVDWLPELQPQEKYYACLFARSKYLKDENGVNKLPHIKSDKAQLKRFVSDKERLIQKIEQLEIPIGRWYQREHSVPQEALALYITVNPRNLWKATFNSLVKLSQAIRDDNKLMNPHAEVLSEIQRTKSRTVWVTFDIDYKGQETDYGQFLRDYWIPERIGNAANFKILETRGGYHILIDASSVEEQFKKSWHQKIRMNQYLDHNASPEMIPVPGCTQGNFIPHFIN